MDQIDEAELNSFEIPAEVKENGIALKEIRIVLIGESGVGKSSIMNIARAQNYNNQIPELAPSTTVETFTIPNEGAGRLPFDLTFIDVPGSAQFFGNAPTHLRNATVVWIFYDMTRKETFDNLAKWIRLTNIHASNAYVYLVGNKRDLVDADESARQVPRELAEKAAKRHKFLFYEASKSLQRIFEFMIVKSVKSVVTDPRYGNCTVNQRSANQNINSGAWTAEAYQLIETLADSKFGNYGFYTPLVRFTAPNLLKKEIQDKVLELKVEKSALEQMLVWIHFMHKISAHPHEMLQILQVASAIDQNDLKIDLLRAFVKQIGSDNVFDMIDMANTIAFDNPNDRALLMECLFETANWYKSETEISHRLDDKTLAEFTEYVGKNQIPQMESEMDKEYNSSLWFEICAKLYEERDTTGDLTVNIGSESMKVHKFIVARRCDYFKAILTSRFREQNSNSVTLEISNDITLQAVELVMRYLYTNDPSHITDPNDCLTVTGLASYLMLTSATKSSVDHSGLLNHCEKTTVESITVENCVELLGQAFQDKDDEVLRLSTNFAIEHYFDIVRQNENEFVKLPKALLFVIMNKVLFNVIKDKRAH
jgi:GTPase SAR1 family protein